mmetsp:Transcript_6152/g.11819  ORF Transcript_6152/g.11819 Transcript_6152/m.11819 type:complete len:261 (-) Transcript_6152:62-844(-)|eukprot:CAMPEP_0201661132 /NCGR_PEP_ID=MMETSP0494-20130426/3575_1 /ASSEMBLY_ACC=CAM_ASM_000839 /TAXON_ID=420259 /ORGANISM="Thalassiosira gravida, Strain GMp14c1" /LENGTH=260 /DNA_ID=CAMNT_0048139159 /DNA_START=145 /DNA_END=927 /DNA_ORIENTATION=+
MAKSIIVSITAQTKMALHAAKHGFSNPIHGIVLGRTKSTSSAANANANANNLEVMDVVPVCHEVPTKPIVDMALRLTDAYLRQQQNLEEGVKIIGWYTANANTSTIETNDDDDDIGELPNSSACRIASSMAENINDSDGNGNANEDFVLLLVSTSRLATCVKEDVEDVVLPICKVFEKDKSRAFTLEVDDGRVITSANGDGGDDGIMVGRKILSEAMQQISEYSVDGGIFDFVDHLTECGQKGDWIENGFVKQFVLDSAR